MRRLYKIKRFSREDHWLPMPPPFPVPKEYNGEEVEFLIETNSNYDREYAEHQKLRDPIYKKRLRNLRKILAKGHLYSDSIEENFNTHCLEITKKFHYLSKDIDSHNRLTYYVYPPYIESGKLYVKVVLDHCTHHRTRKEGKLYSQHD